MAILVILVVSLLAFRAAGALGVSSLNSWKAATRSGLATMLLVTASAHYAASRHDLARMVPEAIPYPMALIYFTGVCEVAGAMGILQPRFRRLAGICLIVLLVVVFPANIRAAREGLSLRGSPAAALWLRLPMQFLFIALVAWSSVLTGRSRQS